MIKDLGLDLTLTDGGWIVFQSGKVLVSPPLSSGRDITSGNEQYKLTNTINS